MRSRRWWDLSGAVRLAPADATAVPALLACVCTGGPLTVVVAAGRPDLAAYTAFGAFTGLYARNELYRQRALTLAVAAAVLVASVAIGAVVGVLTDSGIAHVLVVAGVAGLAKLVLDVVRAGPPGALMPTMAAAITVTAVTGADLALVAVGLCAASATWSWLVCMSPRLIRPDGPQRVAIADALRAVARRVESIDTPSHDSARHAAALALERAWHAFSVLPRGDASEQFEVLLVHAETVMREARLAVAAGSPPAKEAAVRCRQLAVLLRGGSVPQIAASVEELAELAGVWAAARLGATSHAPLQRTPRPSRLTGLTNLRFGSPEVALAGRTALAAAVAGLAAEAVGLGHSYWASVSAVAVLAPMNLSGATQRAVQRATGSALGVLIAVVALAAVPRPEATAALVIVCTALAELTVTRNYGVAMLFTTPIALMLSALAHPLPPVVLARDRVLDTVLGAAVAVAVALMLPNRGLAQAVQVALDAAQATLDDASTTAPADRLATARVVAARLSALRTAYDAAAGEPWWQDVPAERVLVVERAGHTTLARLTR